MEPSLQTPSSGRRGGSALPQVCFALLDAIEGLRIASTKWTECVLSYSLRDCTSRTHNDTSQIHLFPSSRQQHVKRRICQALRREVRNEHHTGWVERGVLVDALLLHPLGKAAGYSARAGSVALRSTLEDWPDALCIPGDSRQQHREPSSRHDEYLDFDMHSTSTSRT